MLSIKRLWGMAFALVLAFSLAVCITVNPGFRSPPRRRTACPIRQHPDRGAGQP